MAILFIALIIVTCAALAFFVLIQNPKGGGLAGSFGGFGNQMMGAKQSTDVVEKGTWIAGSILLVLTLLSFVLRPTTKTDANEKTMSEKVNTGVQAPAMPQAPQGQMAPAQQGQTAPAQGGQPVQTPAPQPTPAQTPAPTPAQ
jgi:preprotein translocase subunit SecG